MSYDDDELCYHFSNLTINELVKDYKNVMYKVNKLKRIKKDEKPKKKLSAYNLFIKEKMKTFNNIKISSRDKMKQIAILWNELKNSKQEIKEEEKPKEEEKDEEEDEEEKKEEEEDDNDDYVYIPEIKLEV